MKKNPSFSRSFSRFYRFQPLVSIAISPRIGFLERFVSGLLLLTFFITFVVPPFEFSPLHAQSVPQLNSTKPFSGADLQPYVNSAKLQADESSFMNILNGGEQAIEASWEAAVDAEINSIVSSVTSSDPVNDVSVYQQAVRAQLELQKQQAKGQWLADATTYIQTELQSFLNILSQTKSTTVTSSNTNSVNTIDPTVQSTTAAPAAQNISPAQAAQSYYQGAQAWDNKWQDLLAKQATWEQNSLNSIQDGLNQWDNSILRAIQEKQDFLTALDQEEALWLNNGNLIEDADQKTRDYLAQIVGTIGSTMQQTIGTDFSQDAALQSAFSQAQNLVTQVQSLLSTKSPLDQIAQTLGEFFEQQKEFAQARAAYWDDPAQKLRYYTGYQSATYNYYVGGYSASGSQTDMSFYGSVAYNQPDNYNQIASQLNCSNTAFVPCEGWGAGSKTLANANTSSIQSSNTNGISFGSDGNLHTTQFVAVGDNCVAQSGVLTNQSANQTTTCNASGFAGYSDSNTCTHGYKAAQYCLYSIPHGNGGNSCAKYGYKIGCDQYSDVANYNTASVTTNYTIDQNNLQQDQFLYGALHGTQFGDNNGVFGSIVSTNNKVWLGGLNGTQITSLSQLSSNAPVSLLVQTDYIFEDPSAIANRNLWSGLASQYDLLSQKLLGMVTPLQNWAERNETYKSEYSQKLTQLRALRASATTAFDDQISDLQLDRDTWLTEVYGHEIAGYSAVENPDSQYRQGQRVWENTIANFKNAELNWYLSSKDTLEKALQDPSTGELKFIADGSQQVDVLQNQITTSEQNTAQLYNTANKLIDAYYYEGASENLNQAIVNKTSEANWNQQGADLSVKIRDSYARSEAYSTADLDATNRINGLVSFIYGNGAYAFDSSHISQIQSSITGYANAQVFWQEEKDGASAGFGFAKRKIDDLSTKAQYTTILTDVDQAAALQSIVQGQEKTLLKQVSDIFEQQTKYEALSQKFADEGKFEEAQYYKSLALKQAGIAGKNLKSGYSNLSDVAETQVQGSNLTFTRNSYFAYSESLLLKGNFNASQVANEIRKGQDEAYALSEAGIDYNSIQDIIGVSKQLLKQGDEQAEKVKVLISRAEELANRSIGGELLVGLNDVFDFLSSQLPDEITTAGISQVIAADSIKAREAEIQISSLLQDMDGLLTNSDDLKRLADLRESASSGVNLSANTAMIQYLDEKAQKMIAVNKERSAKAGDSIWEQLNSGAEYQYLRDQGYKFSKGANGTIVGMRSINSGVYQVTGDAMTDGSYTAIFVDQYMNIQTQFAPAALSFTQLNADQLGDTKFNSELLTSYLQNLQNQEEEMNLAFEKFSDKTEYVKSFSDSNEQERIANEDYYRESRKDALAQFNGLQPELQKDQKINLSTGERTIVEPKFESHSSKEMTISGGMSEEGKKLKADSTAKGEIAFQTQKGYDATMFDFKESLAQGGYDFTRDGENYNGIWILKGSVSVSGIPVEMTYGEERISVPTTFHLPNMGFDFNFNGAGEAYTEQKKNEVYQRYGEYLNEIIHSVQEWQAKNQADADAKKLVFDVGSAMVGGHASVNEAARSVMQDRVTGALSEAFGLPASFVGVLVGHGSVKDALKAYAKDEATQAIADATGVPSWVVSSMLAEKTPKKQWYQSETFQMVTSVAAVVAAPFTGGASLLALAALGALNGAASGGLEGAVVGAAGAVANAYVKEFTGGAVGVNLSYSKENGFGASVAVGYGPATVNMGVSEHGGTTVGVGLQIDGLSAGLNYNSKTGTSTSLGYTTESGSSLALTYNQNDGFGVSASKNFSSGMTAGVSWSQGAGLGGSVGYSAPEKSGNWKGTGGSLNFNERDGLSASLLAKDGVTAATYDKTNGFQANTNYAEDRMISDVQNAASEKSEAEKKAKQKQAEGNQHQGADAIAGAGQKREEDILDHIASKVGDFLGDAWDGAKNTLGIGPDKVVMMSVGEIYGAPGNNSAVLQTLTISGSSGPNGEAKRYEIDGPNNKSLLSTVSDWFSTSVLGNKPKDFASALSQMRSGSADARQAAGEWLNNNVGKISKAQQAEMDIQLHHSGVLTLSQSQYDAHMKTLYNDGLKSYKAQREGTEQFHMTSFQKELFRTQFGGLVDKISVVSGSSEHGVRASQFLDTISGNEIAHQDPLKAPKNLSELKGSFADQTQILAHEFFHRYQQENSILGAVGHGMRATYEKIVSSKYLGNFHDYEGTLDPVLNSKLWNESTNHFLNNPNDWSYEGSRVYKEQYARRYSGAFISEIFNKYEPPKVEGVYYK